MAIMQVVSGVAAAHKAQGSSADLATMDEVARWLPSLKQPDAEGLATLREWYLSHVNWVPPPPEAEVGADCIMRDVYRVHVPLALQMMRQQRRHC